MKKRAQKTSKKEEKIDHPERAAVPLIGLAALVQRELREFVVCAGMRALDELLERECSAICGPRYRHDAERSATRGGHAEGSLGFGRASRHGPEASCTFDG